MSYVDARRIGSSIYVSERISPTERKIKKFRAPFFFYTPSPTGQYTSMFGETLEKHGYNDYNSFKEATQNFLVQGVTLHESDVKVEYKLLEREYHNVKPPTLNIAVVDIETEADPTIGYSRFENPYGIINAVTVYQSWEKTSVTLCIAPPTLTREEAQALINDLPNAYVCEDETELLLMLLSAIQDADVITGWNSNGYDLPYIIQRIRIVLGGEGISQVGSDLAFTPSDASIPHLKQLCLFGVLPRARLIEKWGRQTVQFSLSGRVALDYLELYKKFTFSEQHSYKLGHILQVEINETKVEYSGSLDQLWKNDFRLFIQYNIQDVLGIVKMDEKLKFIDIANETSHMACVFLSDALGAVTVIEQAVLMELHHTRQQIARDKNPKYSEGPVPGAYVIEPEGGMYEWVSSYDVNSLYPSVIRMLNISPECLVGQFDVSRTMAKIDELVAAGVKRTDAWATFTGTYEYHDIIDRTDKNLVFIPEGATAPITLTGEQWSDIFKDETTGWSLSANGTVFSLEKQGILPFCLQKWYADRKAFQKKASQCYKEGLAEEAAYWDRIQHVRKIFLNSLYGALLNEFFRFNDPRFGQSVTLSGRVVLKHMCRKANEIVTGVYDVGTAVIYGDTDSCYLSIKDLIKPEMSLEDIRDVADAIGDEINASFPQATTDAFFVNDPWNKAIEAGREIVAERGIFKHHKKKRYALAMRWKDDKKSNKLYIKGMETQRSDTPAWIQKFLLEALELVVNQGKSKEELSELVSRFRAEFRTIPHYRLGSSTSCSKLTIATPMLDEYFKNGGMKPAVHWAVMAAYWYNRYKEYYKDTMADPINDGDKLEVLPLLPDINKNPLGCSDIGVPVGMVNCPDWLAALPIDVLTCETKLVDSKLNSIFDMLNWKFSREDELVDSAYEF